MARAKNPNVCKCIDKVDKLLAKSNAYINTAQFLSGRITTIVSVTKRDKSVRARVPILVPSFCPFCGVRVNMNNDNPCQVIK